MRKDIIIRPETHKDYKDIITPASVHADYFICVRKPTKVRLHAYRDILCMICIIMPKCSRLSSGEVCCKMAQKFK